MTIPSITRGSETVTILRKVSTNTVNDYGHEVDTIETLLVNNCLVAFGSTSEPVDINRNAADIALTVYMPKNTIIADGDIFVIRDIEYVKNENGPEMTIYISEVS
jgi:hypothetical protein